MYKRDLSFVIDAYSYSIDTSTVTYVNSINRYYNVIYPTQ